MTKIHVKVGMFLVLLAFVASSAMQTRAYPPFLAKAKKYGATDCTFSHTSKTGGEGYNARGKWLIAEKTKRGAASVDPAWLAEYKAKKGAK
jgi:hypothetical protein